jgi:NADH-quinone oxidoreductase subunit A
MEATQRFPVKFYLVAMLFVIFDVEIVFLFAWAVRWDSLGWYGVAAVGIFTLFVLETLAYVWKRGALDWNVHRRTRYVTEPDRVEAA